MYSNSNKNQKKKNNIRVEREPWSFHYLATMHTHTHFGSRLVHERTWGRIPPVKRPRRPFIAFREEIVHAIRKKKKTTETSFWAAIWLDSVHTSREFTMIIFAMIHCCFLCSSPSCVPGNLQRVHRDGTMKAGGFDTGLLIIVSHLLLELVIADMIPKGYWVRPRRESHWLSTFNIKVFS